MLFAQSNVSIKNIHYRLEIIKQRLKIKDYQYSPMSFLSFSSSTTDCRTVIILAIKHYSVRRLLDSVSKGFLIRGLAQPINGRRPTFIKLYKGELLVRYALWLRLTFIANSFRQDIVDKLKNYNENCSGSLERMKSYEVRIFNLYFAPFYFFILFNSLT